MAKPLLSVKNLTKHFSLRGGIFAREVDRVHAVDGVSFEIEKGETLGLVGESGCGKSTLARMVALIETPTEGTLQLAGVDALKADRSQRRELRRTVQLVFQNPFGSLKDRIAKAMLERAVATGSLSRGQRIVAPSSGNTGIALAGISLAACLALFILLCCTCDLCGLGFLLEAAFAGFGAFWWLTGHLIWE